MPLLVQVPPLLLLFVPSGQVVLDHSTWAGSTSTTSAPVKSAEQVGGEKVGGDKRLVPPIAAPVRSAAVRLTRVRSVSVSDDDTRAVRVSAIEALGALRGLEWVGDADATPHLLASLVAEATSRVSWAVADARDQEYSWAQVAELSRLGATRAAVRLVGMRVADGERHWRDGSIISAEAV